MTDTSEPGSRDALLFVLPTPARPSERGGGGGGDAVEPPSRQRQSTRLGGRFDALREELSKRTPQADAVGAVDPELILVFETRGSVSDSLLNAAARAGLELLFEVEDEFDPDENFPRRSGTDTPITGYLHVAMANAAALSELLANWRTWSQGGDLQWGLGALASVFEHLSDVRTWNASDRTAGTGLLEDLLTRIDDDPESEVPLHLELWYFDSDDRRRQAEEKVSAVLNESGGRILARAELPQVGYLGLAAQIPLGEIRSLIDRGAEQITLSRRRHPIGPPGGTSNGRRACAGGGGPG